MAESEEELKSLLMKVKAESEKAGLKFNIQKTKIMASSPITSWQIDGETMEIMKNLFPWASKLLQLGTSAIKLKDTCSVKKKKVMTILESIVKSRDIILATNICLVKAMFFQ